MSIGIICDSASDIPQAYTKKLGLVEVPININFGDKVFKENTKRKVPKEAKVEKKDFKIKDGDIVIAAITSCTNTSNPSVMIGAGLLAKNAVEKGLKVKPWVKTSLAPGSQVVTDYLEKAGLNKYLDQLGFNLVGYGCTTCIGNSGPLDKEISDSIHKENLYAVSVLSGNRNFEGRISPHIKANYLASPPLVVAYALAGHMEVDLYKDPLGKDKNDKDIFLKDIWPSNQLIEETLKESLSAEMFVKRYSNVLQGPEQWQKIKTDKEIDEATGKFSGDKTDKQIDTDTGKFSGSPKASTKPQAPPGQSTTGTHIGYGGGGTSLGSSVHGTGSYNKPTSKPKRQTGPQKGDR